MESADSKFYPGIAREPPTPARPRRDPGRTPPERRAIYQPPGALHPQGGASTFRSSTSPARRRPSSWAPTDRIAALFTALDNLIAQRRVPVMIAISIGNGGGDAQGSERGLEYDTMSGKYAEFVEKEVLPLRREEGQREADQGSRRPRDHGRQFRRLGRA